MLRVVFSVLLLGTTAEKYGKPAGLMKAGWFSLFMQAKTATLHRISAARLF